MPGNHHDRPRTKAQVQREQSAQSLVGPSILGRGGHLHLEPIPEPADDLLTPAARNDFDQEQNARGWSWQATRPNIDRLS